MTQEYSAEIEDGRDTALIQRAYRNLLKCMPAPLNKEDKHNIRAAFELAAKAHQQQRRKSGEPYILHPIEVARICVEEIGLGPTAVVCALLHDVVEDTEVTLKEIHAQFGERVALIVDGLTKLDSLHDSESPQAENLTKVLRTMLSDVRVVLIKMADRLHNLRTIKSMAHHKQIKIAAETSSIYAPLAHRLGLYKIKTEFQDICLKISHPDEYHDIAEKLAQTKRAREQYIETFKQPLQKALEEQLGSGVRIIGRPKSIYSIWNKIRTKQVDFEDIYDLFAIRIILDVPPEREKMICWQAYAVVTDFYTPIPERLKDWITNPKANGYTSLHTSVMGPQGRYVEVQIRTERMDEIAERGFAAHWKYKGIRRMRNDTDVFDNWLNQVRDTLENVGAANAVEVLINLQSDLFSDEVHVFTPKGEMRILPEGATALDFAFSIHSDVGCTCRAVRVNNRIERISYVLKNGDQIQVITDKNQRPAEDWLNFVISSKARNRIRSALKEEKRQLAALGREILERKLNNMHKCPVEENADMLAKWYGYHNRLEFFSAIALEQVDMSGLKSFRPDGQRLVEIEGEKAPIPHENEPKPADGNLPAKPLKHQVNKADVFINGEPGTYYAYSFATCCNPVQGDPIFAYVTANKEGVKIHRTTCPNAPFLLANYEYRVMKAEWGATVKADFIAAILVTGIDAGPGVIQQITDRISGLGINIRSFSITGEGGYFEGRISLVVANTHQLNQAILALKSFKFVANVSRME
ncbi:MAG: bifunctional (p)ppGpp synthetase/guanosine-3',5'-bis(diphosphate) 3'-pyrophosphohydrolase [Saprospiraceae bacterium]|jgi:guanosine-3',5'-bis(diphosphate) 3'-pyrophosphohydrolase|nr:bifunctional (p)ppGpp synthetase/guanosine-3',5'-bis(diphosphate) 3'-pyrophosphohydrolase [Saprospiraceae bacterium]